MKDSGSAPQPVDPYTQAAAQYGLATGTANYNARLNRTNQQNPLGSTSWQITGYDTPAPQQGSYTPGFQSGIGPNGGPYLGGRLVPSPSSSASPSSGQPQVDPGFLGRWNPNLNTGTLGVPGLNTGGVSRLFPGLGTPGLISGLNGPAASASSGAPIYTQTTRLAPQFESMLEKPIDTSGIAGMPGGPSTTQDLQNTRDALYKEQMQFLQPEEQLQSEQLKSQLENEGAMPGSAAYNNEMDRLSREQEMTNSNARNQAITGGGAEQSRLFAMGSQALQDQLGAREAPISEYNQLLSPQSAAAAASAPDIMSAFNQQYQGQLAGYNAGVASDNATTSDIGSLAAALIFA